MVLDPGNREWDKRRDYAETMLGRANGALPEMECSKALASMLVPEVAAGDRVADIGCGAGHYLRSLRERIRVDFGYTGVEPIRLFLSAARVAWRHDQRVRLVQGSIFTLPFRDRCFDIVLCSNVLQNLPSIEGALGEILRVARRLAIIRALVGSESFRIQEVYSQENWPFSDIRPGEEFDEEGEPRSFGYQNIYSKSYVDAVVRRVSPGAEVEFIEDRAFDPQAINRSAESEGLPVTTRALNGFQVFGNYILQPWAFIVVRFPRGRSEFGC
jgi:ubiquinone/menaquinone biosynthesis C-methylase UbiE